MSTAVLPSLPGLAWPVEVTPEFSTIVRKALAGQETRVALRPYPLKKWKLKWDVLRQGTVGGSAYTELQQLFGFFNARQGQFDSFLFEDTFTPDNQVTGQAIGNGDGSTLTFQLFRTFGGFAEQILAPNLGQTVNVYVNGVLQSGSNYSVGAWGSSTPGIVTFGAGHAPGNGLAVTADFYFYWPVRFNADTCSFSEFMSTLTSVDSLELQQVLN